METEKSVATDVMIRSDPQGLNDIENGSPESGCIKIDFRILVAAGVFGVRLSEFLFTDPVKVGALFENALHDYLVSFKGDAFASDAVKTAKIRFYNIPQKKKIRLLRAKDINKFISIDGVCRSSTQVKPRITIARFKCQGCSHPIQQPQHNKRFERPGTNTCPNCHNITKWIHEVERDSFTNVQHISLQEPHDNLKFSEQPQSITIELSEDLTGRVNAGNRLTVNGIMKVVESKNKGLVVNTVIEANNIEMGDQTYTDIKITDEEVSKIKEFSKQDMIHNVISDMIAPSIYGYSTIKTALALQQFGSTRSVKYRSAKRGDIHILLIGDPGVAKSQMLDYMRMVSVNGIPAMGGLSTSAGLTATAIQNTEGVWEIIGGALVMATGGLCCIDEFEKMSKEDRATIHGAMEQQKIDVNKAGISTTLPTRCSVLAAANPKSGRWDDNLDMSQQIDLPASLLSRFDLIFRMRDTPDAKNDSAIARHILEDGDKDTDMDFLKKYIAYARREITPVLPHAVKDMLHAYYTKLRPTSKNEPIPITARKIEDLMRLCYASARLRLSNVVEEIDAQVAIELVSECLKDTAYDKSSGKYDVDRVLCDCSAKVRPGVGLITKLLKENGKEMSRVDIYTGVMEKMDKDQTDTALDKLSLNSWISISPDNKIRLLL